MAAARMLHDSSSRPLTLHLEVEIDKGAGALTISQISYKAYLLHVERECVKGG